MSAEPGPGPPDRTMVRTLAAGGVLNFVGALASALNQFLLVLLVTRAFPAATAGEFFAATSVFLLLVGLGRLGSGLGLVYFVSRLRALGAGDAVVATLRVALSPVVVLSVALSGVLLLCSEPIAEAMGGGGGELSLTYLRWLAAFIPFAALLEGVLGATRGYGNMSATVAVERAARPFLQLLGVAVVALVGSATLLGVAWALPYVPALVAAVLWLAALRRREHPQPTPRPDPPAGQRAPGGFREYWAFTFPRAIAGLGQVALQRVDVVLVAAILDPSQAAVYVAATRLIALGTFGIQAVTMAMGPQVAALHARGQRAGLNSIYRLSTGWLMMMTWPLYIVALLHAPTLLLLFGPAYAEGGDVLRVLAAASLLSTACGVVDVMLTMAGRSSWVLGNVAVALTLNVGLNLLLIPRIGIEGAALAWSAAIVANNLLPLAQLWWSARLHPVDRSTLLAGLVVVAAYGVPGGVGLAVAGQGVPTLATTVAVGTLLYALLVGRFKRRLHIDDLLAVLPHRRSRG